MRKLATLTLLSGLLVLAVAWVFAQGMEYQRRIDAEGLAVCASDRAMAEADADHYKTVAEVQRDMSYAAMAYSYKGKP